MKSHPLALLPEEEAMHRLGVVLFWVDAKPEKDQHSSKHGMWLVEDRAGDPLPLRKLRFVPGPLSALHMDSSHLTVRVHPSLWEANHKPSVRHGAQAWYETDAGWVVAPA